MVASIKESDLITMPYRDVHVCGGNLQDTVSWAEILPDVGNILR